jgi:uncharacterized coiled-coil protein SlyX
VSIARSCCAPSGRARFQPAKTSKTSGASRRSSSTSSIHPLQTHEAHSEQAHQDALIAELRTALADMRRGRDEWREQAHRLALLAPKAEPVQPKPEPAQIEQPSRLCRAWRWMRAIGCLAGAGSLLALSTVPAGAQQQQPRNSRRRDASRLR